uniref:Uncharacterized protein n=1 Tax=Micrurus corallinus TaxID=54390 RepID=A0A2D4EWX1_MICCO
MDTQILTQKMKVPLLHRQMKHAIIYSLRDLIGSFPCPDILPASDMKIRHQDKCSQAQVRFGLIRCCLEFLEVTLVGNQIGEGQTWPPTAVRGRDTIPSFR